MTSILSKRRLSEEVYRLEVEAPLVARERKAGQFVIVQADEDFGERIPLTIADADAGARHGEPRFSRRSARARTRSPPRSRGTASSSSGPWAIPRISRNSAAPSASEAASGSPRCIPSSRALKAAGNEVIVIAGARTADLLVMQDELRAVADELIVVTDDGSAGRKALVTEPLKELCAVGGAGGTAGPRSPTSSSRSARRS